VKGRGDRGQKSILVRSCLKEGQSALYRREGTKEEEKDELPEDESRSVRVCSSSVSSGCSPGTADLEKENKNVSVSACGQ
jgi:hypothetical protein